jgi:hypothetical protein
MRWVELGDEYVSSLIDVRHNEDNVQGLSVEEIIEWM